MENEEKSKKGFKPRKFPQFLVNVINFDQLETFSCFFVFSLSYHWDKYKTWLPRSDEFRSLFSTESTICIYLRKMFTYLLYAYQITHPRHLLVENFRNEGTNKAIINAIIQTI